MAQALVVGTSYRIKLTDGSRTDARFNGAREIPGNPHFGWPKRTHYQFTNLRTGRDIELKSTQKVLGLALGEAV